MSEETSVDAAVVEDPQPYVLDSSPTPADIAAVISFLEMHRRLAFERVAKIEELLGFISSGEELSVRIARIERFNGI